MLYMVICAYQAANTLFIIGTLFVFGPTLIVFFLIWKILCPNNISLRSKYQSWSISTICAFSLNIEILYPSNNFRYLKICQQVLIHICYESLELFLSMTLNYFWRKIKRVNADFSFIKKDLRISVILKICNFCCHNDC